MNALRRAGPPVLVGVGLGVLALVTLTHLDDHMALEALTALLALTAGIYVGFALVAPRSSRPAELAFAGGTVALGLAGLWIHPASLAAGFILHGMWDALHVRPTRRLTPLPRWYPAFCLTFDWLVAAAVLSGWR